MEQTINIKKAKRETNTSRILNKILIYSFLTVVAIFMLIPFYWMINTALKSELEVMLTPPTLFPTTLHFENFGIALEKANLLRYIFNTLVVASVSTLFGTIFSILVAYALSRLNFKGKDLVFTILLATMMIPGEMMVLTNYITVSRLGWVGGEAIPMGNYMAMIIPFLVAIVHIYLLRQNFKQIPNELYYAAKVDGVGDWKYLWKVVVPIGKSSIITIIILKMMGAWNAYVWPNLVSGEKYRLITNGLRSAFSNSDTGNTMFHLQMAATIIVTVPLIVVFILFRKYIMSGVSRSGIKG